MKIIEYEANRIARGKMKNHKKVQSAIKWSHLRGQDILSYK